MALTLLSLPRDILVMLPDYLDNIEDYVNVSSTCRLLYKCMDTARPPTILRLALASSRVFFRPSPLFLVCAVARQVGDWARESHQNEAELAAGLPRGIDHLMDLALRHNFGLTLDRIRELHQMRFSIINPVSDLIDKCVGAQWYALPDFWDGGAVDACTIAADPLDTVFHMAIYGELFGPDFDAFLYPDNTHAKKLKVDTRLEFIKYCIPDFATECYTMAKNITLEDGTLDPRRALIYVPGGPYRNKEAPVVNNNNIALKWLMKSPRWRPHWRKAREDAGALPDFDDDVLGWEHITEGDGWSCWQQIMLENIMQCQGLEGLGMVRPGSEIAERWQPKIREWREKIGALSEPAKTKVGEWKTHEYPDLWSDLWICSSGYVAGQHYF